MPPICPKSRYLFSRIMAAMLVLLTTFGIFGCKDQYKKPNIIVIVSDALRAKQLPLYGYDKIDTPNLDQLASESVLFNNSFIRTPVTGLSIACLFSGQINVSLGLKNNERTLAEYLRDSGYNTVGIVSSRILWSPEHQEKGKKKNQFNRGFQEYIQDVSLETWPYIRENEDTTLDCLRTLERLKQENKPYFLFIHYMDPHSPHIPSYDAEIEKVDVELGKIIHKLKSLDLYDNSMIIFTSDHGESLRDPVKDHGSPKGHGWLLYLEQIQVPLIIKLPDQRHVKTVDQITRNIDVMPTILDYAGIKITNDNITGLSLRPAIEKDKFLDLSSLHIAGPNRVRPEGSMAVVIHHESSIFQYIRGQYSDQYQELFNITQDRNELINLYPDENYSHLVAKADKILTDFKLDYQDAEVKRSLKKSGSVNEKDLQALKSLGYITGGAPTQDMNSGLFVMRKKIADMGHFDYFDLIRRNEWGLREKDSFFPEKIIPVDDSLSFIIAGSDRHLYEYNKSREINCVLNDPVLDMAYNSQSERLYVLMKNGIHYFDLTDVQKEKLLQRTFEAYLPVSSIYIDFSGNTYLLKDQSIVKIPLNEIGVKTLSLQCKNSAYFSVDRRGNIFIAKEKTILKYTSEGNLDKSFSLNHELDKVSSICIDTSELLWVLEKNKPVLKIFANNGDLIDKVRYMIKPIDPNAAEWHLIPTKQVVVQDRVYLIDNWEGILVYSFGKMD